MHRWDDEGDNSLWLFTLEELTEIPEGTVLEDIGGEFSTKGVDHIDNDTRFGYSAYGIRNPEQHALRDLFLQMKLKT